MPTTEHACSGAQNGCDWPPHHARPSPSMPKDSTTSTVAKDEEEEEEDEEEDDDDEAVSLRVPLLLGLPLVLPGLLGLPADPAFTTLTGAPAPGKAHSSAACAPV